jgi:hypothetical protein
VSPKPTTIVIDDRPVELPEARKVLGIPAGRCFGCWLGDDGAETHDVPDDCEYLGGFVYEVPRG